MAEEVDDAYLVHRAQEGFLDAFEMLVERHAAMAYRVSLRMLGNHHDAQDLAQESLLTAWRSLDRFRGQSAFSTWLYRIVTRRALNRLTRGKTEHSLDLLDELPDESDPQVIIEQKATADAVTAAVAQLPLPQRTVIVLHHFEGLSYEQVAEVTKSSVSSVRSHLFRARRRLATMLQNENPSPDQILPRDSSNDRHGSPVQHNLDDRTWGSSRAGRADGPTGPREIGHDDRTPRGSRRPPADRSDTAGAGDPA